MRMEVRTSLRRPPCLLSVVDGLYGWEQKSHAEDAGQNDCQQFCSQRNLRANHQALSLEVHVGPILLRQPLHERPLGKLPMQSLRRNQISCGDTPRSVHHLREWARVAAVIHNIGKRSQVEAMNEAARTCTYHISRGSQVCPRKAHTMEAKLHPTLSVRFAKSMIFR